MKYLVDTNAWIGFLEGRPRFSPEIREIMEFENWECRISMASIWEASIKVGIGKLRLGYDLQRDLPGILEENGFHLLVIDFTDAVGVHILPELHGDPFDRIQIVQAQQRDLTILSHDSLLDVYDVLRIG